MENFPRQTSVHFVCLVSKIAGRVKLVIIWKNFSFFMKHATSYFGSSSFPSSESHPHGGGNLEPDGANLYTKARNRPLARPRPPLVPPSELGHICGHHHIPPGGAVRHVLGPVSQFPSSSVRCGEVIDAMENTAQQNDESKRNLPPWYDKPPPRSTAAAAAAGPIPDNCHSK